MEGGTQAKPTLKSRLGSPWGVSCLRCVVSRGSLCRSVLTLQGMIWEVEGSMSPSQSPRRARLSCHLSCLSVSGWVLALSPVGSGRAPNLSLRAELRVLHAVPVSLGSLCLTWGAVPRLSFLPRCQRGQPVGSGCRRQGEGVSPRSPRASPFRRTSPGRGGEDPPSWFA